VNARLLDGLRGALSDPVTVGITEGPHGCLRAPTGISLTGVVSDSTTGTWPALPKLVAPLGASAVFQLAVPASPLAQPWSVIGSNIASASAGVTCAR
jgi:CBS domain-containing membrane protein